MTRTYDSPAAFKQALEQRLRSTPRGGLTRARQMLVFDRFLARVDAELGNAATLKGGLVLELRLDRARTTKDIDLRMVGPTEKLLERLQLAGRRDLADFMTFEVAPAARPQIQNDAMPYDGLRFKTECRLAGKLYGQPFGVDVGFGDPVFGKPEIITARDLLAFAGIAPPKVRLYPVETHLAEKLHAYTMPRARPNSRVKDLPDMALLATSGPLRASALRKALALTFGFRKTHPLPGAVPVPPEAWRAPYEAMAREDALRWTTLEEVHAAVSAFLDPVLSDAAATAWSPRAWRWTR